MLQTILNKIQNIFPNKSDDSDTRYFKVTLFLIIGLFGSMVLISLLVFFTNLKGNEKIIVPNVISSETTKIDIIDGIIMLQEKYLNVKIQEKHSSQYARGIIIEQKPKPGAVVKAGRLVTVTVSKGPVISKIGDYRGKRIDWLKLELRSKFVSDDKVLLEIREPVMLQYHDTIERGIIIEQEPKAGTPIYENRVNYLDLVVSNGPKGEEVRTQNYLGMHYLEVIRILAAENIPFVFEVSTKESANQEGLVIAQEPEPEKEITRLVPVRLTIAPVITIGENEVFDIFEYIVEKNPIPVDIKIVARYQGEAKELVSLKHEGGKLTFPYKVTSGTEIVVYILDLEQERFLIEKKETD